MPPEGHLRGAGPPTSCDAAVGLTASLGSVVSNQNDPNHKPLTAQRKAQHLLCARYHDWQRATSWADHVARYYERQQKATAIATGWRGDDARWNDDCRHLAATAIAFGWRSFIARWHVAHYHKAATDIAAG